MVLVDFEVGSRERVGSWGWPNVATMWPPCSRSRCLHFESVAGEAGGLRSAASPGRTPPGRAPTMTLGASFIRARAAPCTARPKPKRYWRRRVELRESARAPSRVAHGTGIAHPVCPAAPIRGPRAILRARRREKARSRLAGRNRAPSVQDLPEGTHVPQGGTVSWAGDRDRLARALVVPGRRLDERGAIALRHRRRAARPGRADRRLRLAGALLELLDGRAGGLGPEVLPEGLALQDLGEGEMAMVSMPGSTAEKFFFTVRDDTVAEQINRVMGKRVSLHYEEKVGFPLPVSARRGTSSRR